MIVAKFMAVHTIPDATDEEKFQAMTAQAMKAVPKGFTWVQTHCDFTSHKFFCEWEAPSKEALEQAFKSQNFPFDAVYPVKIYSVAKKKFV